MDLDLTISQREVLDCIPDTRRSIANELGTTIRAVRYRMDALEDKGFKFSRDDDGVWDVTKKPLNHEKREPEEPKRVDSYAKAQATKDVHNELTKMEKEIKEILNAKPPVISEYEVSEGTSTLVIPRSDDHFGAKVEPRQGEQGFEDNVGERRINEIVDRAIERSRERGGVEDAVLGLFGDHVDGETIYNGQLGDIQKSLRKQITHAARVYVQQIRKLSDEFENVHVATVPGNHGSISKEGSTNADNIVFDQIEIVLSTLGDEVSNVTVNKSYNNNFVEFPIRDYRGYARHGQDSLGHLGTSSGKYRWHEWSEGCDFDVAYYGHYHTLKMEKLGKGRPVFQCGSVVPPSLFADSVAEAGRPAGFYHFATDEEIIDEIRPVRF